MREATRIKYLAALPATKTELAKKLEVTVGACSANHHSLAGRKSGQERWPYA